MNSMINLMGKSGTMQSKLASMMPKFSTGKRKKSTKVRTKIGIKYTGKV